MRHRVKGTNLSRPRGHRKALIRNLVSSLVEHGEIQTTITKAKALRSVAERMVTIAREGDLHARRQLLRFFYKKSLAEKMLTDIAPLFVGRPGGYTRIVKMHTRYPDNAQLARISWVETAAITPAAVVGKAVRIKSKVSAVSPVEQSEEVN